MADIKEALTKKYGPLPLWGWGAVGVGGFVVWRALSGSGGGEQSLVPYPSGALVGGGSGGSGGTTTPPTTTPPVTTPPPSTTPPATTPPDWQHGLGGLWDWLRQLPPLYGLPSAPQTGVPGSPGAQTPPTTGGGTTTPGTIPGVGPVPETAAGIQSWWSGVADRLIDSDASWRSLFPFVPGNAAPERTLPGEIYAGLPLASALTPAQQAAINYNTPEFAQYLSEAGTELPQYSLNTLVNYWTSGGYAGSQSDLEGAIGTNVEQIITNNAAYGVSREDTLRSLPPNVRSAYESITGSQSTTGFSPTGGSPLPSTVQTQLQNYGSGGAISVNSPTPDVPITTISQRIVPSTPIPAPSLSVPSDWNVGLVTGGATIQPMPTPSYAPTVPSYGGGNWQSTLNNLFTGWLGRNRTN